MPFRCATLMAMITMTLSPVAAASAPLAQTTTSAHSPKPVGATPCAPASGVKRVEAAALSGALGLGASAAIKKAGVKNAEVVGLVLSALLTDKIACLLNHDEQTQAATATSSVLQQAVGTKVDWTSTTRPGVTGTSSVTAESKKADGSLCRMVRDVVIVGGEETMVSKTLCRAVGATGFSLAAAG